ncbi:MAG: AMP-binding protein, partial [Pseudomonadota bacterium]|nr:AMP-binding protein [Pseudomonadota bacterium]
MHPSVHAATYTDKPALIVAETGETVSYGELDRRSNRAAQVFRACGLSVGDTIAVFLDNVPEYYDLVWGAQRSGLFYVCIPSKLTAPEVDYIVRDSGAKLLIVGEALAGVAARVDLGACQGFAVGAVAGFADWRAAVAAMPDTPIPDERAGVDMLYSSGTTGRPKGVRVALPEDPS